MPVNQIERTNVGSEPLRWSVLAASREFATNRETLQRRIVEANIDCGPDGLYSTQQIVTALTGDERTERIRHKRAQADNVTLKNQELEGSVIPISVISRVIEQGFISIKQEILGCMDLSDSKKDAILKHLEGIQWNR
jgi:hypothetical protein